MPYIDKQYMIDRFGADSLVQLTDRIEPYTGIIDDSVLNQALVSANGVIEGYISGRYATPLSSVPEAIKNAAANITYYILHRDRYTDEVRQSYKDAIEFLRDISNGKAHLSADGIEPSSSSADARVVAPKRIFSRDSLRVY